MQCLRLDRRPRRRGSAVSAHFSPMEFVLLPLEHRVLLSTTITLAPTADAYVHAAYGTANYGSYTSLAVNSESTTEYARRSYLKFNIGSATGKVTDAKL